MKILLLTSYFYPDEHIGAARWNRQTKYLRKSGHEIYVIAADNNNEYNNLSICDGITRINSSSSLPDRFLKRISGIKKDFHLERQRQSYEAKPKIGLLSIYIHAMSFLGKLARFPNRFWWSSNEMVEAGINIIKDKNIDIIIATHPYPGCLKAAHILSKKTKLPWVADMRDGWSSYYYSEYRSGSLFNIAITFLEKKYLKSCSNVVTVNKQLGETLKVEKKKVVVIPNSYDPEELMYSSNKNTSLNNTLTFAFAGNILEEHCWDIFLNGLAEIITNYGNNSVCINYYGSSFDRLYVQGKAAGIPADVFKDFGYISKSQLRQELKKADFLLVFGFHGSYGNTVTTGKIFDYIEAEKPVIVIGSPYSELAQMVSETGIGRIASDLTEVIYLFNEILKNKDEFINKIVSARSQEKIEKYSSIETSKLYVKLLSVLVKSNF